MLLERADQERETAWVTLSHAACREEPADMWQMRDPLPKAWQDFVTARLMVRGPLLSQQQDRPHFAVKWHSPADGRVQNFAVTDGHLIRC